MDEDHQHKRTWRQADWRTRYDTALSCELITGALSLCAGGPYYKTWADYHVKYFEEYKNNGITFWGVCRLIAILAASLTVDGCR
jgi:hypothetical protein